MRLFLALTLALLAVSVSATQPNTPNNGTPFGAAPLAEPMCMLQTLEFTNHLTLTPLFSSNHFTYSCSCNAQSGPFSTVVHPSTYDWGSSVEITFNGVQLHHRSTNTAISNSGAVANSPFKQSQDLHFQEGHNTIVIGVGCNGAADPDCYYEYTITCDGPPGGFITGDPQFVGLRGQNYQVHGVSGEIYNIVSDVDLQYNSRFVFLDAGECPVVDGKKQKACWSHPGSYLGELGLKTRAGDKIHLITGPAKDGFSLVEINGKELAIGDTVLLAENLGSVSRNSTHLASITIGNWDFAFENSDMFVNQRVRVLDSRSLRSHGLLGQTWRQTTYPNAVKHIQGTVDDYVIREKDIFGDNFVFNTFN